MPRNDWNSDEVTLIITDYFAMLLLEMQGVKYNKTEHRNELKALIDRSDASIEQKHRNISAVLIELGHPSIISGYKPLPHYQALLFESVQSQLNSQPALKKLLQDEYQAICEMPATACISDIYVETPKLGHFIQDDPATSAHSISKHDYIALESSNRNLGLTGEKYVVAVEQKRLLEAGKENLAADVDHVAVTKGDGLGYDIHSFETNGKDRLIEVKTTRHGIWTPFFLSVNEIRASKRHSENYMLYRLFNFKSSPSLYWLRGELENSCSLQPVSYRARPI